MDKETLKKDYKAACENYLKEFCTKHGLDYESSGWIADRPGEIAEIGDSTVDMQTIIDDIESDSPEEEFFKWYYYTVEMGFLGVENPPPFRLWINGCPRKSYEEISELKALKAKIERLKEELENRLNDKSY